MRVPSTPPHAPHKLLHQNTPTYAHVAELVDRQASGKTHRSWAASACTFARSVRPFEEQTDACDMATPLAKRRYSKRNQRHALLGRHEVTNHPDSEMDQVLTCLTHFATHLMVEWANLSAPPQIHPVSRLL